MLPGIASLAGRATSRGSGFTDKFTGTDGQSLAARTGWTFGFGNDCVAVASNALAKKASSNYTGGLYFREDDGLTTQTVRCDFSAALTDTAKLFPMVLVTGTAFSNLNGYALILTAFDGGAQYLSLQRFANGSASNLGNLYSIQSPIGAELRASVSGVATTLQIFLNGAALSPVYQDTDATRRTNGRRAMASRGENEASSGWVLDNYSDNGPA